MGDGDQRRALVDNFHIIFEREKSILNKKFWFENYLTSSRLTGVSLKFQLKNQNQSRSLRQSHKKAFMTGAL